MGYWPLGPRWFRTLGATEVALGVGWLAVLALGLASAALGESIGWLLTALAVIGLVSLSARFVQIVTWLVVAGLLASVAAAGSALGAIGALGALAAVVAAVDPRRWLAPTPTPAIAPAAAGSPAPAEPELRADPFGSWEGVAVETIGGLLLRLGGTDITARLKERRRLGYIWTRLLVHRLAGEREPLRRARLAAEMAPGVAPSDAGVRQRKQIGDLQRELPAELVAFMKVTREALDMEVPDSATTDVAVLRRLVQEASGERFDDTLVRLCETWLRRWAGREFLPEFELLEEDVAPAGSGAALVTALREEVRTLQADLAVSTSRHLLGRRQPNSAIALLEPLAEEGRDDIDRLLIQACMEAGQTTRAAALRRRRPTLMEV